jgi:uncharacterized cupredoxin-like copper-binding protein
VIRRLAPIAVAAAAFVPLIPGGSGPPHRLHLPPPPLAHSLTVDEQEWSIVPSERVVAAGRVTFEVYDRGMDAHDLVIVGPGGVRGTAHVSPGTSATIVARLYRGTYLLYCSMFFGTPQSHYAKGMHTLLTVR